VKFAPARLPHRLARFRVVAQRGAISIADTAASGHDARRRTPRHVFCAEKLGKRAGIFGI
jgi:hypothetical protein